MTMYKADLKQMAMLAVEQYDFTRHLPVGESRDLYFFDDNWYMIAHCIRDPPKFSGDGGTPRVMLDMTIRDVPDGDLERFVRGLEHDPKFLGFAPVTDTVAKRLEPVRHLDIRERPIIRV